MNIRRSAGPANINEFGQPLSNVNGQWLEYEKTLEQKRPHARLVIVVCWTGRSGKMAVSAETAT